MVFGTYDEITSRSNREKPKRSRAITFETKTCWKKFEITTRRRQTPVLHTCDLPRHDGERKTVV